MTRRFLLSMPSVAAAWAVNGAARPQTYLSTDADRFAFLRWFTFLAEVQYFIPPAKRASEITDCSSLLRYAYREALRLHDSAWASQANLPLIPAMPSVRQYNFPRTPTGSRIFRIGPKLYGEFADAKTLLRYNSTFISRDLHGARSGDLLFYRNGNERPEYHSMVVIGSSQITPSADRFVVYDTGPDGESGGTVKRLRFVELLNFPEPRWAPISSNPAFLGVCRWSIVDGNPA